MIKNSSRRSILFAVCLFALAIPAVRSFAQTTSTPPTTGPGTATPQTVTGGDPKPVWPPSMSVRAGIE